MNKWVEIDAEKILQNLSEVKAKIQPTTSLLAVLKDNAYGQGAVSVGQLLAKNKVTYFGVTHLEEAMELRQAGIETDILIFAPLIDEKEIQLAFRNNLTITVASRHDAELVNTASGQLDFRLRVHLKMDTGLSRFGLTAQDLVSVCQNLKANSQINLEGIYTHMADPNNQIFTQQQFASFQAGLDSLGALGIRFRFRHCASSAVFINYPEMQLDMVRVGTLLAGQLPAGVNDPELKLSDPFQYKTRIIAIEPREKGAFLGYKRTYRLKRKSHVAVIPVGYADGLGLEVNNPPEGFLDLLKKMAKQFLAYCNIKRFRLHIRINNQSYPIAGKVFMQTALVEVPLGALVKPGDEVIVPVRKTLVARDVPRLLLQDGEVVKIDNHYLIKEGEAAVSED